MRYQSALFVALCYTALLSAQADSEILTGRFTPEKKAIFAKIPARLVSGNTQYLNLEALKAFESMAIAAKRDGFNIKIISGTRNFYSQKAIWEQKFNGKRKVEGKNLEQAVPDGRERSLVILRFSSMPGTSRHHWGTDADLHETSIEGPALHNASFKKGRGLAFYEWLLQHAGKFGFCQPYTGSPEKRNPGISRGYQEERWHWSYAPVAKSYLKTYQAHFKDFLPKGFAGDSYAADFYKDYVQNVDASCQ